MKSIYYGKYLKYKKKYLELKNQIGGVKKCDTNYGINQSLYNVYGKILELLMSSTNAANENDYDGTRGALNHSNSCNLWVWKKSHNHGYTGHIGDPVNHIDIFWDENNEKMGYRIKKNSAHVGGNQYFTISEYKNDNQYANLLYPEIISLLNTYFP